MRPILRQKKTLQLDEGQHRCQKHLHAVEIIDIQFSNISMIFKVLFEVKAKTVLNNRTRDRISEVLKRPNGR